MAEDIEIQIEAGPPAEAQVADKVGAEVTPAPQPKASEADSAVEELKRQIETERSERLRLQNEKADAERRAQDATKTVETLRGETQNSHLHVITTAISANQQELVGLKNELRAAYEAGDYDKAADINVKMADNRAKFLRLNEGKDDLEARIQRPKPQEGRVQPQQPERQMSHQERFDAYVNGFTPKTAEYMRAHPEIVTDDRTRLRAQAFHLEASADGIAVDTPEYFAFMDKKFGWSDKAKEVAVAPTPAPRRQAAAPVSRDAPASTAGAARSTTSVRLSADEQDMAKSLGMTNEEYARNKLLLQSEGKLAS